nr:nucleotidyltransferase family protein [Granulicella sp. dw_53]
MAAGSSRRLGRPKQTIVLAGETLLERTLRVALEAGLNPVYIVVSSEQNTNFGLETLPGCTTVLNEAAEEGMASSIRAGVNAAANAGAEAVVIMACDQPAVTSEHLRNLAKGGQEVIASEYAGRRGVPAYFPAQVFQELTTLQGDTGARNLLQKATYLNLPNGELDVDTAEELQRAQTLFE